MTEIIPSLVFTLHYWKIGWPVKWRRPDFGKKKIIYIVANINSFETINNELKSFFSVIWPKPAREVGQFIVLWMGDSLDSFLKLVPDIYSLNLSYVRVTLDCVKSCSIISFRTSFNCFLYSCASGSIQTLDLLIMSRVLYRCATFIFKLSALTSFPPQRPSLKIFLFL